MSNSLFDMNMNVGTGELKVVNSNTGEVIFNKESGEGHVRQIIYTKENLFRRLVNLEEQMETLKADIKAAKEDFTCSDDNPQGLDKEVVKEIAAFAKKYVAEKVDAVIEQAAVFEALKEELIG